MVAIRGVLVQDGHGAFLIDHVAGQDPSCALVPTAVAIREPGYDLSEGETRVAFRLDPTSKANLDVIAEIHSTQSEPRTEAVFFGELHVRIPFMLALNRNYAWVGNGFGHMGMFSAQLVIKTVSLPTEETGASPRQE
jgi:hypothetical protein